jgi:hypothetical protein
MHQPKKRLSQRVCADAWTKTVGRRGFSTAAVPGRTGVRFPQHAPVIALTQPNRIERPSERRARRRGRSTAAPLSNTHGAVNTEADIALATHRRFARMDAHANTQVSVIRPGVLLETALRHDRRRYRVLGSPESDEEGVSLRVDLVTPRFRRRPHAGSPDDPRVLRRNGRAEA